MERLERIHHLYWIELFAFDEFEGRHGRETWDIIRAWSWRAEHWERRIWQRGGDAAIVVRPQYAEYYARLDAGEPGALFTWSIQFAAAVKLLFADAEEQAA